MIRLDAQAINAHSHCDNSQTTPNSGKLHPARVSPGPRPPGIHEQLLRYTQAKNKMQLQCERKISEYRKKVFDIDIAPYQPAEQGLNLIKHQIWRRQLYVNKITNLEDWIKKPETCPQINCEGILICERDEKILKMGDPRLSRVAHRLQGQPAQRNTHPARDIFQPVPLKVEEHASRRYVSASHFVPTRAAPTESHTVSSSPDQPGREHMAPAPAPLLQTRTQLRGCCIIS